MLERNGLCLDIKSGALTNIPRNGSIVLIGNHPYGTLDCLIMGYILARRRNDFRILAHRVFDEAKELKLLLLQFPFTKAKRPFSILFNRASGH